MQLALAVWWAKSSIVPGIDISTVDSNVNDLLDEASPAMMKFEWRENERRYASKRKICT